MVIRLRLPKPIAVRFHTYYVGILIQTLVLKECPAIAHPKLNHRYFLVRKTGGLLPYRGNLLALSLLGIIKGAMLVPEGVSVRAQDGYRFSSNVEQSANEGRRQIKDTRHGAF